ncbi:MAG: hypothetical protein ABI623_03765 [bacterium]
MNSRNILLAVLGGLLIIGMSACKTISPTSVSSEDRAEYHMVVADSLEAASSLREAALEYKLVAELYPSTSHYPNAVRNTALLYSNPTNPAADDSLSLQWFQTYLTLSIPREEKVKAEIYVTMLQRINDLRREIVRRGSSIDSLQTMTRKQTGEMAAKSKRVQDLEGELKKTTVELQNLREVDVRISRRKGGR